MKTVSATIAAVGALMMYAGGVTMTLPEGSSDIAASDATTEHASVGELASELSNNEIVDRYCVRCHSERRLQGNLSLEDYDATAPESDAQLSEKVILKLRAGMMPPPGANRPGGDTLQALAVSLENRVDEVALDNPNPGSRPFQRLNRAEYGRSVRNLLNLEIDAGDYLPLDTKSANFDNIADVQMLSPTLLNSYMNAAAEVSRLAMGDRNASARSVTFTNPGYISQWDRVPGAPYGTRGGVSVVHNFPADGEYRLSMTFEHTTTGGVYGGTYKDEDVEISVDGERKAVIAFDRWMSVADPNGVEMELEEPITVTAGPHRITAAFIKKNEGPMEDVLSPHDWSIADRQIGASGGYGVTTPAHMKDLIIHGPVEVTGVSETPSREHVLSCRPTEPSEERPCAEKIIERLGPEAFRRPLTDEDRESLMSFYEFGYEEGGFEIGIRTVVEALLASPDFIFRFEEAPADVQGGDVYRINDIDLAARLSYFLWGLPPDDELIQLAAENRLSDPEVLDAQVDRMLDDPRSEALATRFAAQWLRLGDLDKVHPDRLMFPDFHEQLKDAMRRETELLFDHLVREDKSFFELYTADYTFVNERLARHYGIDGVTGDEFRRVSYPEGSKRPGILGHGSILTLTSHAGRTSPVLRGKWIMEVVMGTPPPPPPPGVPSLDETADEASEGRNLTTKERMEMHRANPTCNACHRFIDPIGLALDNFDVTGQWRIKEGGVPLDTRGELYDGTPVTSPLSLQDALLDRSVLLLRSFTSNLMAYALGRRTEYFDQPTIRKIVDNAEEDGYSMTSFVKGIVKSDAFQMQKAGAPTEDVAADAANQ
ncbi:MAG: DUF1592 domain-containing protein [Gemmatimonadota bacterium]|nr:DUF1592 domain-containing protein [Gemmatimonadota bacterium]